MLVAILVALSSCARPGGDDSRQLDTLWDSALKAGQEGRHDEASRLLDAFVDVSEREGIFSAEAHHNLAISEWARKHTANAVYHAVRGAQLSSGPASALRALSSLASMEEEMGLQVSASRSLPFALALLLRREWLVVPLAVGLWSLVALGCALWLRPPSLEAARWVAGSIAAVSLLTAAAGWVNSALFPLSRIAVVSAPAGTAPLFRGPSVQEDGRLAELPSGMLVRVGPGDGALVNVIEPVGGWVDPGNLRRIEAQ